MIEDFLHVAIACRDLGRSIRFYEALGLVVTNRIGEVREEGIARAFQNPECHLEVVLRADGDGNLYVAVYGQGQVLAFNRNGIPIGQVLLPGRDEGHNLNSTSLAIGPGTDDLYIVTNDGGDGRGATIFHAKGFAKAPPLYSHR